MSVAFKGISLGSKYGPFLLSAIHLYQSWVVAVLSVSMLCITHYILHL
jgi:hypothetical protein